MLAKADKAQEGLESVPEEPVEKKKEKINILYFKL